MSLREYHRKRDFKKTREPAGAASPKKEKGSRYVIQKHAASRLHYDFRLEVDGTLKSWAVPKGLPYRMGEKRLAVQVEDHPVEYGNFEGIIPQGEYGGGTVMLWDAGTYTAEEAARGIAKGKLHFILKGEKLEGEWALIRMARGEKGNEWLIFKAGENARPVSKKRDDESIKSGQTMKQIAAAEAAVWSSKEPPAKNDQPAPPQVDGPKASPAFATPMLAKLAQEVPPAEDWIYEVKFDGYRALAIRKRNSLTLWSRNEKPLHFPEVVEELRGLSSKRFVIDGEIVALDEEGRPSFQRLQQREEQPPELAFYAFDLLNLEGRDLKAIELEQRRELLEELIGKGSAMLRFSSALEGPGPQVLEGIRRMKLEGIIAKRRGSKYESGRRTGNWRKVKCINEQEFVIGGFTEPGGSRKHFGALLLGYFDEKKLRFAGKVGTGFTQKTLKSIHEQMKPLIRQTPPFADFEQKKGILSAAERRRCTWIAPKLVGQVRFTEWTDEGILRHPAFLGLREDKEAPEVIREQ